eukprot:CAMPEP_0174724882 /NCGR_PEP_ID=MMETSP1094-20130205/44334_1 /TAXON_ID=156173 /ORGANISM="Chrysochromulina brevifilum, Strain UTEX LB 985" /LENGTH=164 /DNA_ID=CAMNT_0015926169 /DNA_START=83 /DNA_END=577 /DNA_ORIENTATION=-
MAYAIPPGGICFGSKTPGWQPSPWTLTEHPSGRHPFGGTGRTMWPRMLSAQQLPMLETAAFVNNTRAQAANRGEMLSSDLMTQVSSANTLAARTTNQIKGQQQKQVGDLGKPSGVRLVETMNSRAEEIMYHRPVDPTDTQYLSSEMYQHAAGDRTETIDDTPAL